MIVDSLRYWVSEMHVDGFRFDLASILGRDVSGQPMLSPPILWEIESDPVLCNEKHNERNGEQSRDGASNNISWNCGIEGPSNDPEIETLRNRQIKNFLVLLLFSIGTPMLQMGDEVRRSQWGNNNAYCQDNPTSWCDWELVDQHACLHRFTRELIALAAAGGGVARDQS